VRELAERDVVQGDGIGHVIGDDNVAADLRRMREHGGEAVDRALAELDDVVVGSRRVSDPPAPVMISFPVAPSSLRPRAVKSRWVSSVTRVSSNRRGPDREELIVSSVRAAVGSVQTNVLYHLAIIGAG
jgi:hypothetical protein